LKSIGEMNKLIKREFSSSGFDMAERERNVRGALPGEALQGSIGTRQRRGNKEHRETSIGIEWADKGN